MLGDLQKNAGKLDFLQGDPRNRSLNELSLYMLFINSFAYFELMSDFLGYEYQCLLSVNTDIVIIVHKSLIT